MNKYVKSTLSLVCICAVMAVLLALTNGITAPTIKANQEKAEKTALLEVMPGGEDFSKLDLDTYDLPATVTDVYAEKGGGYVVTLTTKGYASKMIIMCGVTADGRVSGATCLSSEETLGYEKTFGDNFVGKDASAVDGVDSVSGATKTTVAYKNAVADALSAVALIRESLGNGGGN